MTLEQIEEISARNLQSALNIIKTSGIINLLHRSSKRVNVVGSVRTGLLAKHLDIDIHFYTPTLDAAESFKLIGDFAARGDVESANFKDLSYTDEKCFEWHLQYAAADKRKWTFDLIQILEGSKYDGYFESVADKIKSMLTPENKATILSLKFAACDSERICGIEYCAAVLKYGVKTFGEFENWRKKHSIEESLSWF